MSRKTLRARLAAAEAENARLAAEVAVLRMHACTPPGPACTPASAWLPNATAACTCGTTSAVCPVHPVMRMPTVWASQQNYWNGCAAAPGYAFTWNPGDEPLTIMRPTAGAAGCAPPAMLTFTGGN